MEKKKIWVDADSCPEKIRPIIVKGGERKQSIVMFIANRKIPIPISKYAKMIIITDGDADSYIIKKIQKDELAITRDIPLAEKLLEKGACVLNDRGLQFTSENIHEKLSIRNFSYNLRKLGIYKSENGQFSVKDIQSFSNEFDKALNRFYTF